jgi:hypothetical protein
MNPQQGVFPQQGTYIATQTTGIDINSIMNMMLMMMVMVMMIKMMTQATAGIGK